MKNSETNPRPAILLEPTGREHIGGRKGRIDRSGKGRHNAPDFIVAREDEPQNPFGQAEDNRPLRALTAPWHACEWKVKHPDAYEFMAGKAHDMLSEYGAASMTLIAAQARHKWFGSFGRGGDYCRVNNTLLPALGRMLERDYPELTGAFVMRTSASDKQFKELGKGE